MSKEEETSLEALEGAAATAAAMRGFVDEGVPKNQPAAPAKSQKTQRGKSMSSEGCLEIALELQRLWPEYNKHGGKTSVTTKIAAKLSAEMSHDNPREKMFPSVS